MTAQREPSIRLDPEVRREMLLDAAEQVLRVSSPSQITFDAVAVEAVVSRALVYNYFGDRDALLGAVELRLLERLDDVLRACIRPSATVHEQVLALANAYVGFSRINGSTWHVLAATRCSTYEAVTAARQSRVDWLADLWGGTEVAALAARLVTTVLECVATDWCDGVAGEQSVEQVCGMLTGGLVGAGMQPAAL